MHYLEIANSPGMWVASSIVVVVIIVQAFVFMRKAYKTGLEMGISREAMQKAMRAGFISSIGPSLAVGLTLISLMVPMGSPYAWMRLSIIGSIPYELMAASTGAQVMGVELGGEGYDIYALSISMWTATIAAGGWLILCAFMIPKFETLRLKIVRGREELLPILTISALLAGFSYFTMPYLIAGGPSTIAAVTGGVVMTVLALISLKVKWLKEWALGIAMIIGMLATLPFI
jgi:hypothetical protein